MSAWQPPVATQKRSKWLSSGHQLPLIQRQNADPVFFLCQASRNQ